MTHASDHLAPTLLIMVAGAKGAIGSTIAVATAQLHRDPQAVLVSLTTADKFPGLSRAERIQMAGWDSAPDGLPARITRHGVLPEALWRPHLDELSGMDIRPAPPEKAPFSEQVEQIRGDMADFRSAYPMARPVLVNLLPAAFDPGSNAQSADLESLYESREPQMPDLAYAVAALAAGIPVVNFTPNTVELPALCREAELRGVPLAGRDGKTGQTYLKVVLASAFKARSLGIEGWYSVNILGNADGRNLMDPDRACGKLQNKTRLLEELLGYRVGEGYDSATHIVRIDYYPPRGDAKEAWDVIDFKGLFGLPMSLRLNLQGRDSILAAPMVIDLARWAAAARQARIGGPVAELGFYFKKPVGERPPLTFQDQLAALGRLEKRIEENWTD